MSFPGKALGPLIAQVTGAAPQGRAPGLSLIPQDGDVGDITDEDLMTPEEMADQEPGDDLQPPGPYDHDENLAERMADNDLDTIGTKVCEMVQADLQSRQEWDIRFKRGLELVGLKDFVWENGVAPFEGASTAVHPMLADAIVQSSARMMEEVWPAAGPVKTQVMGTETEQKRDSADRVADHMNYQLTKEDKTYFMESQKLSIYLPIFGSAYRKAYHDYICDQNLLRLVVGEDMIIPYSARDVQSAKRKTHRFKIEEHEFKRGCMSGAYRDIELEEPAESGETSIVEIEKDKLDGKAPEEHDDDLNYVFYETDLFLDLPGFEDKRADGQPSKLPLPYTVTVESDSQKVLAIRRCWDEDDDLKLMRTRYAEYWYLPGLGVYGMGLIHWIGTLAEAGTDALRALLDSATWANLQGGFKAKDTATKAGEIRMRPGSWIDVDMTADELGRAFYTPPVREPSEALFKLLGFLTGQAQRFSATTDLMVGEQDAKGAPVGTTVALIEQGSKVYSGVHKRAHFAAGIEFEMLFKLNAKFMPAEGYPYLVPGDDKTVYKADYDQKMVGTVPVSDPNIFSQTQRIAIAQATYQVYKEQPQYFKGYDVIKAMVKALKNPEIEDQMVDPDEVPLMDPISENVAMATGRPVKAKDGENHDLHLVNHMAFAQHPQFGGLPQAQKLLGPAMIAHIAEHVALKYADTMRKLGAQVPPINLSAQNGESIVGDEQPNQALAIANAGAKMIAQFMQSAGLNMPPPADGSDPAQEAQDTHEMNQSKIWFNITTGLANMMKAGGDLQAGMQAEAAVEAGHPPAAPPGGGALAPGNAAPPAPPPGAIPHPMSQTKGPGPLPAGPIKPAALTPQG